MIFHIIVYVEFFILVGEDVRYYLEFGIRRGNVERRRYAEKQLVLIFCLHELIKQRNSVSFGFVVAVTGFFCVFAYQGFCFFGNIRRVVQRLRNGSRR